MSRFLGLWIEACSRTATACARCPPARRMLAWLMAASGSFGFARYRSAQTADVVFPLGSLWDAGAIAKELVASSIEAVVLQPAITVAKSIATASDAMRRWGRGMYDVVRTVMMPN